MWRPLSPVPAPDSTRQGPAWVPGCVLETGLGTSVPGVLAQARAGAGRLRLLPAGMRLMLTRCPSVIGTEVSSLWHDM